MDDIDKRLNYFDHQFLLEKDFTDEQKYHIDRRRRHNRVLHRYGVADGLEVTKSGDKEVTVSPGTAFDKNGHEIVLPAKRILDLSTQQGAAAFITIAYADAPSDQVTATGASGYTRITEKPEIKVLSQTPGGGGSSILLAAVALTAGAVGAISTDARPLAGAIVSPRSIGTEALAENAVAAGKLDAGVRSMLVTNGDSHDHAGGDGGQIKHSSLSKDDGRNPHGTLAADIDTAGGANQLVARINAGTGVIGQARIDPALTRATHDHTGGNGGLIKHSILAKDDGRNPHGTSAVDIDSAGGANQIVTRINAGSGVINQARIDTAIARTTHDHTAGNGGLIKHSILAKDDGRNPHGTLAADIDTAGGANQIVTRINAGSGVINQARVDTTALARTSDLTARFNTSTGHAHDGIDSRQIPPEKLFGVGSTVSAANLNSLTGNADASNLHYHLTFPAQTRRKVIPFPLLQFSSYENFVGGWASLQCNANESRKGWAPLDIPPGSVLKSLSSTTDGPASFGLSIYILRQNPGTRSYYTAALMEVTSPGSKEAPLNHRTSNNYAYVIYVMTSAPPASTLYVTGIHIDYEISTIN